MKRKKKWLVAAGILCVLAAAGMILIYGKAKTILYRTHYVEEPSGYREGFYADKKVLLVVPHEDDEYTVAGGVLEQYVDSGSEVKVVFVTNGDGYGGGDKRIREAIKDLESLGIPEENAIFLGYGDCWETEYGHIYNAPGDEIVTSMFGATQTYALETHPDYRTQTTGKPADYTRNNLLQDMENIILDYQPDVIYSVDLDEHVDHRATTFFFEEALGNILQRPGNTYTPMVFFGFGYCTAWDSVNDFYQFNIKSTVNPSDSDIMEKREEYNWSARTRLPVAVRYLSYTKRSSSAHAALSAHESQDAIKNLEKIVNSDKVFWERDTDGLQYQADVSATSGEPSVLKDYKLSDLTDVCDDTSFGKKGVWIPDEADETPHVGYYFSTPQDIERIVLHDNSSPEDNILSGTLSFSDGSSIPVDALPENGGAKVLSFEKKKGITEVTFTISERTGENAGLMEFEVYSSANHAFAQENSFIKIMSDENFIYDYFAVKNQPLKMELYHYPSAEIDLEKDYNILMDGAPVADAVYREKNLVEIPYDNGEHILRMESKEDASVYDEIHIKPLKLTERWLITLCQKVEAFRDREPEESNE